jgi:Flp pilus assembly pilin Flp
VCRSVPLCADARSRVETEAQIGDKRIVGVHVGDYVRVRLGREDGQTMAEYAIVVGMITIAIVAVFASLSDGVRSAITAVTGSI